MPTAAPSARPSDLGAELELLQRARRILQASPGRALELAAEHEAQFPEGQFVQERELLAIDALRAAHELDPARARAVAFLKRFPRSVHTDRVRALLGSKEN